MIGDEQRFSCARAGCNAEWTNRRISKPIAERSTMVPTPKKYLRNTISDLFGTPPTLVVRQLSATSTPRWAMDAISD